MVHRLDLGGSERQMTEVAKSLDRRLFSPHVGCFHAEGLRVAELQAVGIPILQLPVTSFKSPSVVRGALRMLRYLREHKIRLVHSFDVPLNIFSVPVARLSRGTVVLSSQRAHRSLTPGFYHGMSRITDLMVDGTVVNCEHMRRHLIDDEKVAPENIHLCYNGIDTKAFFPLQAAVPPDLSGASAVIGVVCALRPEKGLATLVEAFGRIAGVENGARLVIVGSGPCLESLEQQVAALGIGAQVIFVPKTNDVARWLRAIDIFVLPSLSEAFSNSLMEAMACGCAVVASRVGGNPELTGAREYGMLFEAGDAAGLAAVLTGLLKHPERRAALAEAGARLIRDRFSRERSIGRMQEIYLNFLSDNAE